MSNFLFSKFCFAVFPDEVRMEVSSSASFKRPSTDFESRSTALIISSQKIDSSASSSETFNLEINSAEDLARLDER